MHESVLIFKIAAIADTLVNRRSSSALLLTEAEKATKGDVL
jgi:hypothetical protein